MRPGLVLIALIWFFALAGNAAAENIVPGRYIVVLRSNVEPRDVAAEHVRGLGAEVFHLYEHVLAGYSAQLSERALARIRADKRVLFVEPDRVVRLLDQTLPTGIDRIEGDLSPTASGDGSGSVPVNVAVIDTGIDVDHPDLNVVGGKNCTVFGTNYDDGHGHGTHVAGTIGAKDDSIGVVGVIPGARLWSVRVLEAFGFGFNSSVICGIDWVAANAQAKNIRVANMSLGGSGSDDGNCGNSNNDSEHKAICNAIAKGVTFVVAAGNASEDIKSLVPAAYDEVLTVTAMSDFDGNPGGSAASTCRTDTDDTFADFSNFATLQSDQAHMIAAPGDCILSTWRGGGYTTSSGTSMASPHVAGLVAGCIAVGHCSASDPRRNIQTLRAYVESYSRGHTGYGFYGDPLRPVPGKYFGYLATADSS